MMNETQREGDNGMIRSEALRSQSKRVAGSEIRMRRERVEMNWEEWKYQFKEVDNSVVRGSNGQREDWQGDKTHR